ncbi:hypothetical protein A9F13_11g00209 [Clavispora lusitaniae]|uniref:Uncharacterized protein n=1 Tax=Clavispora lusitaniae TaxID=36911 RepID=A0AA91PY66_CLALS|nr:hypothetical protein A9F13_11g00209 [Clavispora lusitaniae]
MANSEIGPKLPPPSSSPSRTMPKSPPWYKRPLRSDPDEPDDNFDFMPGASTPLKVNHAKSIMFLSPMRKLDELHLDAASSSLIDSEHIENRNPDDSFIENEIEADDNEDDECYGPGDKTIITEYGSSDEESSLIKGEPPRFVRKRSRSETPSAMEITPNANFTIPHASSGKNSSAFLANVTSDSFHKASFSASDSTPCPTQPRKKLKFKNMDEDTPSQPSKSSKHVLDFSGSRKVTSSAAALMSKLSDAHDGILEDEDGTTSSYNSGRTSTNQNSTPISQSTPANSRAPSPGLSFEESQQEVNGFKFVRPTHAFKYQTPLSRPTSAFPLHTAQRLRMAYHSTPPNGKYEIVGEFPVSAAGLMDEADESLHIADRRINDPYAAPEPLGNDDRSNMMHLREVYLDSSNKLPLLQHFERDLNVSEMLLYITDGVSVSEFYEAIVYDQDVGEGVLSFLKKERLRWHPDKWVGKLETSIFTKEVIDSLSQVINGLIDDL